MTQLFNRTNKRKTDTEFLEFIHGRSLKFKNFSHSVGITNSIMCSHCKETIDSASHQIFECTRFEGQRRIDLLEQMDGSHEDYSYKVLFTDNQDLVNVFKCMVNFIVNKV